MLKRSIEEHERNIPEIKTDANAVAYIRCGPALLAIVQGIYEACGMEPICANEQKNFGGFPSWAEKICEQLQKTILKKLMALQPTRDQTDWRNTGRMLGVLQRLCTFLADAWSDADCVTAEEATAPPAEPRESFAVAVQKDLLPSVQRALANLLTESAPRCPQEQSDFFAGLHEGYEMFLDTNGQFVGDRGRTAVYLELLSRWPEIESMRKGSPTLLDVYRLIAPALGDARLDRQEWFFDVCDDIGLSMKENTRLNKD